MFTNCQLIINGITEAILVLDKDGYFKYSNPAATAVTGYAAEELLNKHLAVIYNNPYDTTKAEYELGQAVKTGKFVSAGWRIKKDQTRFWGESTLSPLYDEQNRWIGFTVLLHDYTEKKKQELELRKSEENYRLMVEGIKEYSIFMLDPEGNIMTWNDGGKHINGYNVNEIIGKHFSIFYTAKDLEDKKPENELRIAIATGKYEEEGWRVKKNGSVFWANIVLTTLYNEQNKLIGFCKVTRDLSDRKEREEELRQSEERYRLLVEQVTDYGIFMMDEKGRIISWNEGAKKIKGYTADEVIGRYFSIFYPEEEILNNKPAMELKVARSVGKYEEEGWRIKKDGSLFWANIVITAVYNKENTLIGFSKVTRDLTERKASERALRDSNESFRALADELRITNTELSNANEELEQFTSIVSHDLQEPVRTIKSFLQLIDMKLGGEQSPELKTYISKAINSANRMKELIQNVLHYAQLSREEIVKEEINVNELFSEALQNMKLAIEASGATIEIENEVQSISGDAVQLLQLIQNLLSNALKFKSSEIPAIKIKCTREGNEVKFAISDNGIGIAEGNLNKVFEIFRRLHTKKDYPGTGIGLAICKKIVDRHHGRIWPESQPGKGTTFYFTLNESQERQLHNEEV
jgi:PAS domain S-box-containing protein